MTSAERNYDIYVKKLLSVLAFQDWRVYLEGSPHPIKVISDHKNLEYFFTTKQLNRRQARWFEFLLAFDFDIHHRPGSLNGRVDVLSRRVDMTEEGMEEKRPLLRLATLEFYEPVWSDLCILERLKIFIEKDLTLQPILLFCKSNPKRIPAHICHRFQDYTLDDGILRFKDKIYVPDDEELRKQILRS